MRSTQYIIGFAAAVCLVCGVVVAGSYESLKERQQNKYVRMATNGVLACALPSRVGRRPPNSRSAGTPCVNV